jgi:hypothetical protein
MLILEAFYQSDNPFKNVGFDGIIGLGFSHLSVNKESNFIDMLFNQKKIKQKLFSFYFNKNDLKPSELVIGGVNEKNKIGPVNFFDIISQNYWEIKINDIYYGDQKLNFCQFRQCTGIIDTGTSMIAAPSDLINSLLSLSMIGLDCSNFNSLKNIKLDINGIIISLDPEYYIYQIPQEQDFLSENKVNCINAFMKMDVLNSYDKISIILGLPFLKKYYTVFDRDNKRIGFALANHNL